MKIMIIGGSGRFGRVLNRILQEEDYSTISLGSKELDLREEGASDEIIKHSPDFIIHAAALSNVDECERDSKLAYRVNVYGTERVVVAADRLDVPLLYISTDYVFNGENPPYAEDDEPDPLSVYGYVIKKSGITKDMPDPLNIYGKSKLDGENFVRRISSSIILRVSWLFGPGGRDFIDFVLRGEGPIPVVSDHISKPTCTVDLSYAVLNLIKSKKYGVYHFANTPAISHLEWAKTILKMNKMDRIIREVNWDDLGLPARRPLNSSLSTLKYEKEFGRIKSWKVALKEYSNE